MAKSKKPKKGGTPPREVLYSEAAKHAPRAIEVVVELMNKGDNDNVKLGAAKTILAKGIPDLRATEITGEHGQLFPITILTGISATRRGFIPTSARSSTNGQTQIQGPSVAQKSKKDINRNKRSSKTSAP